MKKSEMPRTIDPLPFYGFYEVMVRTGETIGQALIRGVIEAGPDHIGGIYLASVNSEQTVTH